VRGKSDIRQPIKGTDHDRLELLPADFSYRHMDLALDTAKRPTRRLAKVLAPLADEYDYIFLDCPPSISLVSESVFETADALLVPIIPATLSSRTFEQLQRLLDRELASGPQVLAFFSMVDWRKRLHRDVIARFDDQQANMLRTAIPAAADVENMGLHRTAIGEFAPSSRAALAYEALWRELRDRLQPTATWDAFTSASDDDELSHGDTRDGRRWRLPTLPARR
jgi:chromosome partitioning protein